MAEVDRLLALFRIIDTLSLDELRQVDARIAVALSVLEEGGDLGEILL